MARYINVNGSRVYFTVTRVQTLKLDDSGSEQCEGCGLDIIDTAHLRPNGIVRCGDCGATYLVNKDDRNPNDAESARRDRLPTWTRR